MVCFGASERVGEREVAQRRREEEWCGAAGDEANDRVAAEEMKRSNNSIVSLTRTLIRCCMSVVIHSPSSLARSHTHSHTLLLSMSDTRRASLDRLDCSKDSIDTIGSGGGDTSSTDTDTIHAVRHLLISFCVWHGFLGTAEVLLESFGAGVLDNDSGSRRLPRLPTAEQQRERLGTQRHGAAR